MSLLAISDVDIFAVIIAVPTVLAWLGSLAYGVIQWKRKR